MVRVGPREESTGWRGPAFPPEIHAVIGRVLADQIDFLYSFADERADLSDDAFDGAAAMPAAHLRDDAESARVIAALGDLDVRGMRRGETETRGVVIGNVRGGCRDKIEVQPTPTCAGGGCGLAARASRTCSHDRRHVGDLIKADEGIDFGQFAASSRENR